MNELRHPAGHTLQAYFDGELDAAQADAIQSHCERCGPCRADLTDLERVASLLAGEPVPELRRPVWPSVRPDRVLEVRFRPVIGFAACAAGIVLGLLIGPVKQPTSTDGADSSWAQTVTAWSDQSTSSLLSVYQNSGE